MDESEPKMRLTETHVYFVGGPLSQWYESSFLAPLPGLDGAVVGARSLRPSQERLSFSHAEQAMMASKASVFGDVAALAKIRQTKSPAKQKELGRKITNFDSGIWGAVAKTIVTAINYHKFAQNDKLFDFIALTGGKIIVEGAWYDRIWGVGLSWDDPMIEDDANWQGTNWLGEAIMIARQMLNHHGRNADPWALLPEIRDL